MPDWQGRPPDLFPGVANPAPPGTRPGAGRRLARPLLPFRPNAFATGPRPGHLSPRRKTSWSRRRRTDPPTTSGDSHPAAATAPSCADKRQPKPVPDRPAARRTRGLAGVPGREPGPPASVSLRAVWPASGPGPWPRPSPMRSPVKEPGPRATAIPFSSEGRTLCRSSMRTMLGSSSTVWPFAECHVSSATTRSPSYSAKLGIRVAVSIAKSNKLLLAKFQRPCA